MALSTMALLEFLDRSQGVQSSSQFFASLMEVSSALDEVFVDGDLNGNGITDATDLAIWQAGYGAAFNASPATGDADGDGDVDGRDFLRWQRGVGSSNLVAESTAVPEPTSFLLLAASVMTLVGVRIR
jgi:hypothetical protein